MTLTTHNEYPKRLIEVDLPIARISAHARREKSIRHGHISTLHIWWARRPLAACRAVLCASLWPDPVDLTAWAERGEEIPVGDGSVIVRPRRFLETARERMTAWANQHLGKVSKESYSRFVAIQNGAKTLADPLDLQRGLLDFIADFANWDNSTDKDYLETARALTQASHEALGGESETRPLVVDPFCGGGSIPLEALRVGADAFASDLNPIPVLLNKVVLEYIPKYGQRLADEVRKWGAWIKQEAEKELAEFYPKDPDGATPIAYLWARTIQCEGPGCGAEVPLMRSLWLAKKGKQSVALRIVPKPQDKRVDFEIIENAKASEEKSGTVKRGSATCPCCGYTTPQKSVRQQLCSRGGGTNDARLLAVVYKIFSQSGVIFKLPSQRDKQRNEVTSIELARRFANLIPTEKILSKNQSDVGRMPLYGIKTYGSLFNSSQLLTLLSLTELINKLSLIGEEALAVKLALACALDKQVDYLSTLARWHTTGLFVNNTYGRQALPMVWDFVEGNPFSGASGNFINAVEWVAKFLEREGAALVDVSAGQS